MKLKTLLTTTLTSLMLVTSVISGMGQAAIYTTGFESTEGFTAGSAYNNTTIKLDGTVPKQWGTYYGTASTTSPLSGLMSMQMRWYTTAPTLFGYTFTNFDIANAAKVVFNASSTNNLSVIVSYSTDGGTTYVGAQTIALTATKSEYTYDISITGEYPNVRLKFQLAFTTAPTATSRVYIDDVAVYPVDTQAPTAVFTPAAAAIDVAVASPIAITLNEAVRNIDNSEITNDNVASLLTLKETDASGAAVTFTATIDAAKKVITITPSAALKFAQAYYVAIAPVEDVSGNATLENTSTFTTIAARTGMAIITFSLAEQTGSATIGDGTIAIEVASSTTVTSLVATFTISDGASVKVGAIDQVSATTINDFTTPVTYVVTAEDGTTKDWVVTVTKAVTLSDANDITGFSFAEQSGPANIDAVNHTVAIEVVPGTIVTTLTPTITVSVGATIAPATNVPQNYAAPVEYTVTAENTTPQVWTVTVTVAPAPAPLFTATYPKAANIGSDKFDVVVNTNAPGKVYFLNLASGATAPTSAEVKAGTAIDIVAAATDYSATISSLTKSTTYDVYFVTESNEASPMLMATPVKLSVTTTAGATTIHDIQYTVDPSGDTPFKDQTVTTSGIVTAIKMGTSSQSSFYIQDGVGEWNGILVYVMAPAVTLGDRVTVTGKVVEYNKLTEFDANSVVVIDNSGNALPAAAEITTLAANSEAYESVLVKVKNANCVSTPSAGIYVVNDGSGDLTIHKSLFADLALTVNSHYDITGVMTWYNTSAIFELYPRSANDVVLLTGINDNDAVSTKAFPNPFRTDFTINAGKVVRNVTVSNMLGQRVMAGTYNQVEVNVPASDLKTGVYFVSIKFEDGTSTTLRMVKK